jgi:hypothetical protein
MIFNFISESEINAPMCQILNESQQINAASIEVVTALFYSSAFVD